MGGNWRESTSPRAIVDQISPNAAYIAHGSRSNHHACNAEKASHGHLAMAKGMFDGTHGGFNRRSWIARRAKELTMSTSALRHKDLFLSKAEDEARIALLLLGPTTVCKVKRAVGTDFGVEASHKASGSR